MKGLTETDFKYLAGLIDADGWCSFNFQHSVSTGKVYLQLSIGLACSTTIDRDGSFINWLSTICGNSSSYIDARGTVINTWKLSKRSDLAKFIPLLTKHMVIKAKHIERLYDKYQEFTGQSLTPIQIEELRQFSLLSRKDAGPLKSKNFPSRAWVAGFLDGDGHYGLHKRKNRPSAQLSVDALLDKSDVLALELLKKTYGGEIHYQDGNPRWYRGLGVQHRAFAISFLKTMHRHSRLKKYKIEQMLAFHNLAATTK